MDARKERGRVIAEVGRLTRDGGASYVPSRTRQDRYVVEPDPDLPRSACPDHESRQTRCKHAYAVEYAAGREENKGGTTAATETPTATETVERKTTRPPNWPSSNAAQSAEKGRVREPVPDLGHDLPEPDRPPARGPRPHTVRDSIFSTVYKAYGTFGSRRFSTDLREAHARGHPPRPIPGMKTAQPLENPAYTPALKGLVARGALPLKAVETASALDSSGFGPGRYDRRYDHRYGKATRKVVWVKCHLAWGVKTNVVAAVRILDGTAGDSPPFAPLVKETAEGFTSGEVSADKACGRYDHFETVAGVGGEAFLERISGGRSGSVEPGA